jgi:formylglycine-generating enzyme required for sulfatase activity
MNTAVHAPAKGMTWIPGGTFAMGSEHSYPEERPVRRWPSRASGATGRR